jgi:hypothetical protein
MSRALTHSFMGLLQTMHYFEWTYRRPYFVFSLHEWFQTMKAVHRAELK